MIRKGYKVLYRIYNGHLCTDSKIIGQTKHIDAFQYSYEQNKWYEKSPEAKVFNISLCTGEGFHFFRNKKMLTLSNIDNCGYYISYLLEGVYEIDIWEIEYDASPGKVYHGKNKSITTRFRFVKKVGEIKTVEKFLKNSEVKLQNHIHFFNKGEK